MRIDRPWIKSEENRRRRGYLIRAALAAAVIFVVFLMIGHIRIANTDNTEQGTARLAMLESGDVTATEKAIIDLRAQRDESIRGGVTDLAERFSDTVIMGDSLAARLSEYELISPASVAACRGASVGNASAELAAVAAASPKQVVFDYGLDDMVVYKANIDAFITDYSAVIEGLRAKLPEADFYLCSVVPVSESVSSSSADRGYTDTYNIALRKMCDTYDIKFINVAELVTQYSGDGIHPSPSFLTPWLVRMADVLGI